MEKKHTTNHNNNFLFSADGRTPNLPFVDNSGKRIRTDDYELAVTLFHTGARLLSVEEGNDGKHIFIFKKIINLEDIIEESYGDLLTVKSLSFLKSIRAFRKVIDKHINKNNTK